MGRRIFEFIKTSRQAIVSGIGMDGHYHESLEYGTCCGLIIDQPVCIGL